MWSIQILTKVSKQQNSEAYRTAYQAWRNCWSPVFANIHTSRPMFSDAFTRQDEVLTIFHGTECAATVFFRTVDLTQDYERHDSYFEHWSEMAMQSLVRQGSKVLICSYFSVMESYRGKDQGLSVKDLLMGLVVRRFMSGDENVMTGTMRNSKGANHLSIKWGADLISKDVVFNSELNDLVGFYHDLIKPYAEPSLVELLEQLWPIASARHRAA